MSTDGPQPAECLAIAFLVEASLALSYEWKRLFQDYVVQLLQRCSIGPGSPNKITRVAFVAYGTADTRPTPIVKKIYFTELRYIIQDIKDDSRRLGIGQTDSGGNRGMAALEGFATVLGMFDLLRDMGPKDLDCRVVHIAASSPDTSDHPHWNQSPSLDSLSWGVLPVELKKRNIQLSGINLSSGLPRFPDLYIQAAAGKQTNPWFSVRTQHHLFISGFDAPLPKAKRAADPGPPERSPESKRPRVTLTQASTEGPLVNVSEQTSPSVQPTNSNSPAAVSSTGTTAQALPGVQPNLSFPPAVQAQAHQVWNQLQLILTKRRQIQEEIKHLLARKQTTMTQGNEVPSLLEAEIAKRGETLQKLSQGIVFCQQQLRRLQGQPQSTSGQQEAAPPTQTNPPAPQIARAATSPNALTTKDPQTPFNLNQVTTPQESSGIQSPSRNPQITPGRSISSSAVPAQTPTNNPAPSMMSSPLTNGLNAQMQKLLQLERNRPIPQGQSMVPSTSGHAIPNEVGMNNNPAGMPGTVPQPPQQPPQTSNPNQVQSVLVWEGILSFNGTGSDGNKKEVHTGVTASSSNPSNSHSKTWPPSLTLVPAQTLAIPIPEFQEWMRRTKPVLCTFKAKTPEDEPSYQMLVSVMSTKGMYATASWQLPSGAVKENVLIFPINNLGLCGAFFPLTGIPEMPKAGLPPGPPQQIPAPIFNLISQLPPEQRPAAIAQLRSKIAAGPEVAAHFFRALLQHQLQQQQQNAQNRAVMANQFSLNPTMTPPGAMVGGPNAMGVMGMNTMNAMNTMGSNPLITMGNSSTMLTNMTRTGTGGGPGVGMNLNYDVLQSFMQRNNPDGSNTGLGPNQP